MKRKAAFSPKSPKPNSSDHNSRKEMPKYLIEEDPNFDGNYYERITPYIDDEQLTKLAKKIYNQKFIERAGQNQRMQKHQEKSLVKEVVISTEEDHTKEDILSLFDMLRREKAEENYLKKNMAMSRLNLVPAEREFKLPKKLKIKRKPKKENLDEIGYHILELAGHYDEGHFIRTGKWDGLSYYPARDIMLKEDGKWYIKSNELSEDKSDKMFDVLVDMSEFEKVYNYHWHVKFTHFNVETGLAARFSKGEISGEGRLKKVAEHLGLRYVPEEKIPLEQGVKSIKEQHHRDRQNKYRQLIMKFQHQVEIKNSETKVLKREMLLIDRVNKEKQAQQEIRKFYANLDELKLEQKKELENDFFEKVKQNSILKEHFSDIMDIDIFLSSVEEVLQSDKNEINTLTLQNESYQQTVVVNTEEYESKLYEVELEIEARAENVIWDMKVEFEQEKQLLQAEVTEKVNELKELEVKNDALEESSANLVETKDAKISELQSDITFHQIINEQRVDKVNTLQTEIESHQKSIKDKVTQIEELENASLASETQHKEKIEVKDNEILSLNQQVQEFRKDVFSETWTWKAGNGKKYKSKNIDVVKQLVSEHKELKENIETLKTENHTLTTGIKEKETQITSDSNNLKESQAKIEVLEKQVQEFKDKEPVIKEVKVIKEIPAKITIDDVKSFEVKEDGENITVIDLFNRKNKAIKELKEHNTSLATNTKEKDALIADLEQEIESDNAWIYTGEIHEVLDVSETYTDEVHETWREKAKELEEKVEELKVEVSQLQKVIDGVKGFISKVFSAFGVGEDEPGGVEKIDKRLATMESLKNTKKEKPQPIKLNTAPKM